MGGLLSAEDTRDGLWTRLTRGAPLAVVLAVGFLAAYELLTILQLIAVGMLLALVLRVIVDGLKRLGLSTWLAVIAIFAGLLAFGAFVWFAVVPSLLQELQMLAAGGPNSIRQKVQGFFFDGPQFVRALVDFVGGVPLISDQFSRLPRLLEGYVSGLAGTLPRALSLFSTTAVELIAVVFLAIYFAISSDTYVSNVLRLVPLDHRARVGGIIGRIGRRLRGWIVGTVIVSLFVGVGVGVGLWILGVPLALTFGILAGVLNVIPFLGVPIAGLLAGLLALTISPVKAILVGVLIAVVNQVDGNVLRPLVFSREVEVPPAWVLVSILVLGTLLGPIGGAFLAIPAAVVVGVLVEELTAKSPPPEKAKPGEGASSDEPQRTTPSERSRDD